MLSQSQIKRVWEGMLGADIRSNYFAELAERYRRRQRFATWFTLLCTSADAATFLAALPAGYRWVTPTLAAFAAGASVYLALSENEQKAFDSTDLQRRWAHFHNEYQNIWEDTEASDAAPRMAMLETQIVDASTLANKLVNDQRAMEKWQLKTENEYATNSTA